MMQRRSHRLRLAALTSAAVIGVGLIGSTPALAGGNHSGGAPKVLARGLDNPRQLSFTKSGDLLVAEAGEGGTTNCMPGPEGGEVCFGTTGSVTKISSRGKQTRIIRGLPSLAGKGLASVGENPNRTPNDPYVPAPPGALACETGDPDWD